MKYCSDTWFILELFEKDSKAISLLNEIRYGKSFLIIPITVFTESIKKLLQKGISQADVDEFFAAVESSNKIEFLFLDKIVAKTAAKISLTHNLSLMDSFVVASFKLSNCDFILASDSDYFPLVKNKYIKIYSW